MNSAKLPMQCEGGGGSVADYYAALTTHMLNFGGDLLALHFGLYGPGTTTKREALLRANETLVQGCDLGPGQSVLDCGCGIGGTAITLAERYGVNTTGITNCVPHIAVAAEHAQQRGISHLVDFVAGDFMDLPFPDSYFDAVLNHESLCYVQNKNAYFRGIYRVLKPGGKYQCLDGFLANTPQISEAQKENLVSMSRNWRMPPISSLRGVRGALDEAGFTQIIDRDLSSEVAPAMDQVRKDWLLLTFMTNSTGGQSQESQDCMEASLNCDQGLREGVITYRFISGTKPLQESGEKAGQVT